MTDKDPIMMPEACTHASCNASDKASRHAFPQTLVWLMLACTVPPLQAQVQTATPTPQQMVEQLKNPRTRSLRNLSVEAAPASAGADAGQPSDSKGTVASSSSASPASAAGAANTATTANAARPALSLLIQFAFNSARVRPESQQALGNLSQALQSTELAGSKFAVEGHTDARGSADYNQRLSQQRALAVRDILAGSGVAQDRLLAAGRGATELANSAEPFAAENRRVRIVNLD